jgi:hypothetical protein
MNITNKNFGQIILNSSKQFWLIDLNTQNVLLKAESSVDIAILKSYRSVKCFVCVQLLVNLMCVAFLITLRKPLIIVQNCNLSCFMLKCDFKAVR